MVEHHAILKASAASVAESRRVIGVDNAAAGCARGEPDVERTHRHWTRAVSPTTGPRSFSSALLIVAAYGAIQYWWLPPDGFLTGDQGAKYLAARAVLQNGPLHPSDRRARPGIRCGTPVAGTLPHPQRRSHRRALPVAAVDPDRAFSLVVRSARAIRRARGVGCGDISCGESNRPGAWDSPVRARGAAGVPYSARQCSFTGPSCGSTRRRSR